MKTTLFALLAFPALLQGADPRPVRTVLPQVAENGVSFRTTGRTAPAEQATLFSRATGIVVERPVDIGDQVKQGDVLAVIDAPEIAPQIASIKARIAQATATAELAAALLERGESLRISNAVSREILDERNAAVKTAEAERMEAEAELKRLEEIQRFLTIRAPFDGTITARKVERGDHVNGDPSSLEAWLYQISRLNELRMVVHVAPSDALQIKKGQLAEVHFPDLPGQTFPATVARSSSFIDPLSGTMQIELTLPNPDLVLPAGLSGTAVIRYEAKDRSVFLVPSNAIITRDGIPRVALAEQGKVKFLDVRLGRTLGPQVEILGGLAPSNAVILSPNSLLREGDPIAAQGM